MLVAVSSRSSGTASPDGDQRAQPAGVGDVAEQRRAREPAVAQHELAVALAARVERDHLLGERVVLGGRARAEEVDARDLQASWRAPRRGRRSGGRRSLRRPPAPARAPAPTARRPCRGARRTRRPPTRPGRMCAGCRRRARRGRPRARRRGPARPRAGCRWRRRRGRPAATRPRRSRRATVTASVRRPHRTSMPSARMRRSSSRAASGSSCSSIRRSARCTTVTSRPRFAQAAGGLQPEQAAADDDRRPRMLRGCADRAHVRQRAERERARLAGRGSAGARGPSRWPARGRRSATLEPSASSISRARGSSARTAAPSRSSPRPGGAARAARRRCRPRAPARAARGCRARRPRGRRP